MRAALRRILAPSHDARPVFASIDVGTNAVRLKLARPLGDGSLETLHEERDPIRPGEGVFRTGYLSTQTADRLLSTLRRYAALCRRHHAVVRAIATSALREAKNANDVLKRIRKEAGLDLLVISGKEEARLICLGVLQGMPEGRRSLVIDIGGGSTEVAEAKGKEPTALWSIALGAVRLGELFPTPGRLSKKELGLMRRYAEEIVSETLPRVRTSRPHVALGSSGTIKAVVGFAAAQGTAHATVKQLHKAVEMLADMDLDSRRKRFDARRAEVIVPGAVILETVAKFLGLESVTAVDAGLRDGLLIDLVRRRRASRPDHSLADAAIALGRRFAFDEKHALKVSQLALELFDRLGTLHRLPVEARPLIEAASLLHDVGHAVNYQRHHRHSQYLIENADLPGIADHERAVVSRIARYHRRSAPDRGHAGMVGLTTIEVDSVRKLAVLLRIADALDRSHAQVVRSIRVRSDRRKVVIGVRTSAALDLELWDVARERALFEEILGRQLHVAAVRS